MLLPRHLLLIGLLLLTACSDDLPVETAPPAPILSSTYLGAQQYYGTIGSLAVLRGYDPVVVSGYGLMINLKDTGTADCPAELRPRMLKQLAASGFGTQKHGLSHLSPQQVLASTTTAVVRVRGIIQPGMSQNSTFDLSVEALAQTQTSSLEGGLLYTTDLSVNGDNLAIPASTILAQGRGHLFINPLDHPKASPTLNRPVSQAIQKAMRLRRGQILGGGRVTIAPPLELILTQPSYRITNAIANRINTRFPRDTNNRHDRLDMAIAKSDSIIQLNILRRYRHHPGTLLRLANYLFINPQTNFAINKAQALLELAEKNPTNQQMITETSYAWQSMGRAVLPILQPIYQHPSLDIRMAALRAGAAIPDSQAFEPLKKIAYQNDPNHSPVATRLLGDLLRLRTMQRSILSTLYNLIDSDITDVRLEAFDVLSTINDPRIERFNFEGKFELAIIPSRKPLIHIATTEQPRIIVFDNQMHFKPNQFFSYWQDRFMVRVPENKPDKLAIFYRNPQAPEQKALTYKDHPNTIAHLIGTMGFDNTGNDTPGLNMSYAQVVTLLHAMTQSIRPVIASPLVIRQSPLLEQLENEKPNTPIIRPENTNTTPVFSP